MDLSAKDPLFLRQSWPTEHLGLIGAGSVLLGCVPADKGTHNSPFHSSIRISAGVIADFSPFIAHQIELTSLKTLFAVTPGNATEIQRLSQSFVRAGNDAGLLPNFANRGGLRFFARINDAFRERQTAWPRFRGTLQTRPFLLSSNASFFSGSLFFGSTSATCQTSAI